MLGNGRKFGSAELLPLSESSALTVCQKVRPKFGRTESSVYHYFRRIKNVEIKSVIFLIDFLYDLGYFKQNFFTMLMFTCSILQNVRVKQCSHSKLNSSPLPTWYSTQKEGVLKCHFSNTHFQPDFCVFLQAILV